ncbi:MAG: AAA family ATPase, partial [Acholeplasma sp.]|nr:AAA family ATPase [Acholeplasma sp.]
MQIRRNYLDKLIKYIDTEFVKLITGVRRSGKSFLLKMLEEYLHKHNKKTIYLNFEHPDTFGIQTADKLYEFVKTQVKSDERVYFLFDEIAEVEQWQKLINGLRIAFNCDIYITGSNANMLSGELATYLSGRYVEIKVFPLSLLELKDFTEKDSIDLYLQEYIKYGGFPSVVLTKDDQMKSDIL